MPRLTPRQLRSLPPALRSVASTEVRSDLLADAQRREARLRQLVATLSDLGASEGEILVRLERQGHPAEAVVRALEERRRRLVTQRASASA